MLDMLDTLRRKSQSTRRAIAFFAAAIIVGAIFFFWTGSIRKDIQGISLLPKDTDGIAPLEAIGNNLSQVLSSFKQGLEGLKDGLTAAPATSSVIVDQSQNPIEIQGENDILEPYEGERNGP